MQRILAGIRPGASRLGMALMCFPLLIWSLWGHDAAAAPVADGRIVYSVGSSTPQQESYQAGTPGTLSAASATQAGAGQSWMVDRACPTRAEHLAGYVDGSGNLYLLRWNGSSWQSQWNVSVGSDTGGGRRFDIAYENGTGNAIVAYATANSRQFAYRRWNGSSWSAPVTVSTATGAGYFCSVKLAASPVPGSNQIAAAFGTTSNYLVALIWNGSSWQGEPASALTGSLQRASYAGDVDSFDLAYENATGDLMVAYAQSSGGVYYGSYSAGSWTLNRTLASYTTYLTVSLASDPTAGSSKLLATLTRPDYSTIYGAIWSGSSWSSVASFGSQANRPAANRRMLKGAFVSTGGLGYAVIPYDNGSSNQIGYAYSATGVNWSLGSGSLGSSRSSIQWLDIDRDPQSPDTLMVTFSDANSRLWAKQLLVGAGPTFAWGNADGGAAINSASLASLSTQNFAFAYDRYVSNATTAGAATAAATGATAIGVSAPYDGDGNGNNSVTVDFKLSSDSAWTNWVTGADHAASPYGTVISDLAPATSYDVKITYLDPDGTAGTNPQIVSGVTTPSWTKLIGQGSSPAAANYQAPAGTNRLLVVAVTTQASSNGSGTISATLGGVALTRGVSDETSSRMMHTALFYLKEAQIPAGLQSLNVSYSAGSLIDLSAYVSVFNGVDQTSPITDSKSYSTSSSVTGASFTTPLTVRAGDQAIYLANVYGTSSATIPTVTTAAGWQYQSGDTGSYYGYYAWRTTVANRAVPASDTTDSASFSFTPSSQVSLSGLSLKAVPPCVRNNPGLAVAPASQSVPVGKAASYTVTVTNNDTGACAPVTFSLSAADTPATPNADFAASTLAAATVGPLNPGAAGSVTLSQNSNVTGSAGRTEQTTVRTLADADHAAVTSAAVTGTVLISSGRIVYSNASTTPQSRGYASTGNSFGAQSAAAPGAGQSFMVDKACPLRDEHIAGYVTTGGVLYIMRWDGSQWSNEWNVALPGYNGVTGRRFDIDYRNSNGSAIVVYSTGAAASGQFAYRTWDGSGWSAATAVTLSQLSSSGVIASIKVLSKPAAYGSGCAVMALDSNGYLSAAVLDPSTHLFGNEKRLSTSVYRRTSYGDVPSFDLAYQNGSGQLLTVNTQNSSSSINYWKLNGSTWTNATVSAGASLGAIFAAADPRLTSNSILVSATGAVGGSSSRIYSLIWNGSSFSAVNSSASLAAVPAVNKMPIAGGFVASGSTSAAVVVYNDGQSNRLGYSYSTNGGVSWTAAYTTSVTIGNGTKNWIAAATYPQSLDTMMATLSDGASDLWAKRLVFAAPATFTWSNADGGSALSTSLASLNAQNFAFAYDRTETIMAEGVAGTAAPVCPGAASQKLDGFSLVTTTGPDSVTALTVTTVNGADLSSLEIRDEAGLTRYFQPVTNPGSDTWNFSGGTPITVTPIPANFKIVATFKGHGSAPAGASDVTAYVSKLTGSNAVVGSDFADTTLSLDNAPATPASWYLNSGGIGSAQLSWAIGNASDQVLVVRYASATDATMPVDGTTYPAGSPFGVGGTVVYQGSATSFTDNAGGALLPGGTYYYRIFEYDGCLNYAASAPWSGGVAVASPYPTIAGTVSALAVDTGTIEVTVPYSGDTDLNNTLSVKYRQTGSSAWISWTSATHPAAPLVATITGLTPGQSYDVQGSYADPDGVQGAAIQQVSAVLLPADSTTTGQATAGILSSSALQVSIPYTDDFNGNNSYTVQWKLSDQSLYPEPNIITGSHVPSPFVATITGLAAQTSYDILVTWNDPDGVKGAPQTLKGLVTPHYWVNSSALHNSVNTNSTKWQSSGGWGISGGKYGTFDCSTCHVKKAPNILRIRGSLTAPDPSQGNLPGAGATVRFLSRSGDDSFGSYSSNGYSSSQKICEVCHSTTAYHKYNQTQLRHEETAGIKDCTVCHPHGNGFKPIGACTICHAKRQGNRAAVFGQLSGGTSHHIQGVKVTDRLCYQCHWEANSDGTVNSAYHGGAANPGAPVQLVIYKNGIRPALYKNLSTAISYSANGSRAEIQKLNNVCLGCHSAQSGTAQPFGDGKTPKQYAWDGRSVAERYSQTGTTPWGKYAGNNTTPKATVIKAFSAHGNAVANQGGYDLNETWTDRKTSANVLCYDCHNSHGSNVPGVTSNYSSATGRGRGGILKETQAGVGGFSVTYRPQAGGSQASHNAYNPGAGICFDCHLNAGTGSTPWGYSATYGALQQIMNYNDTPYFGNGTFPRQQRFAYKSTANTGGHLGASSALGSTPAKPIGGLCTPCHDPHGVTPSLGANQKYGVPLLKGTWLTSPYKEDVTPADNRSYKGIGAIGYTGEYQGPTRDQALLTAQTAAKNTKHIDQNTFAAGGAKVMNSTAYQIAESQDQFAGLCLGCHAKQTLTNGVTHTWKDKNRIHESVKGWKTANSTIEHNFPCAKCHAPHNAGLPRLMAINCMDFKHRGRVTNQTAPVTSGSYRDRGDGAGHMPGSYVAHLGERGGGVNDQSFKCHEGNDSNQQWNVKTPWVK